MTRVIEDMPAALRAHARGSYPDEAAVELVLHAGLLGKVVEFIEVDDPDGRYAVIDWPTLFEKGLGAVSGGERRLLRAAASLGSGELVSLSDLPGLDERFGRLVLQAVAHSLGWHEHGSSTVVNGTFDSAPNSHAGVEARIW
jgi:hypothetical protein